VAAGKSFRQVAQTTEAPDSVHATGADRRPLCGSRPGSVGRSPNCSSEIGDGNRGQEIGDRKSGTDGTLSDILSTMARLSRIVIVNVPHHVTQRGNARQFLLANDDERLVYLNLLRKFTEMYELSVLGYCLMSNHVHLIVVPAKPEALASALKQTHGNYASYWNAAHRSSGHVWQGRFYSCPLDGTHLWVALRYAELNPVRAGLVSKADAWPWSSAAAHCGAGEPDHCLELATWSACWTKQSWREFLERGEAESDLEAVRQCTHTGRPLGSAEFIRELEGTTNRRLTRAKGGRPVKAIPPTSQRAFGFDNESFRSKE
jgi:putative transposase